MNLGILSIIPPIISVILSLLTKEVISSLFLGLISGVFIYSFSIGENFLQAIKMLINLISNSLANNTQAVVFTLLLGSLSRILLNCGSSKSYAAWIQSKIKSKKKTYLSMIFLSFFLSIDDYFSCLTIGTIMKPISSTHKISRAKLAYMLDSLAAPLCVLMPISSWSAAITSCFKDSNVNPIKTLLNTIPYNFYPIFVFVFLILTIVCEIDFGKMLTFEEAFRKTSKDSTLDDVDITEEKNIKNGKILNLIIPVLVLILVSIFMILETGGLFNTSRNFLEVLENSSTTLSITIGAVASVICSFFLVCIVYKLLSFDDFMKSFSEGAKSMITSFILLNLVWSMSSLCKDFLKTDLYIGSFIMESNFSMKFFPVIIFLVSSFLSYSIGSSWGTFGILIPISTIIVSNSNPELISPSIAAVLSGAIFGTHCSPISDNTIMSAAGAGCKHMQHVISQTPYAICVAIASAVGFLTVGFSNMMVALCCSCITLFFIFFILKKYKKIII